MVTSELYEIGYERKKEGVTEEKFEEHILVAAKIFNSIKIKDTFFSTKYFSFCVMPFPTIKASSLSHTHTFSFS